MPRRRFWIEEKTTEAKERGQGRKMKERRKSLKE